MSTILKALKRLEEDQPGGEITGAENVGSDVAGPGAGVEGADDLRERILAEERANPIGAATSWDPSTPPAAREAEADPRGALLRRYAPLAAVALVVLVIGGVVIPALLDVPNPTPERAPVALAPAEVPVPEARVASPEPSAVPRPRERVRTSGASFGSSSPRAEVPARTARGAVSVPPGRNEAEALSRRAAPVEPAQPRRSEWVPVAELPVASPPVARGPAPAPAAEPPVELALVESPRTPPAIERRPRGATEIARSEAVVSSAPTRPDVAPKAWPGAKVPRPEDSVASDDRPIAKTADAKPIERVARPDVPDVTVLLTSWHPDASRRTARIRIEASEEVRTLSEGDAVGALVIKEISPSAVLFEAGEVEVRRRVGAGS